MKQNRIDQKHHYMHLNLFNRPSRSLAFALVVLQLAAVAIFAIGFFPAKRSLAGFATHKSTPEPTTPAYDNLVVVLVDALRSDFVFDPQSGFEFTRKLIRDGHALPTVARAVAPSVTKPRIKAITSGSVPSFLDTWQFSGQESMEETDNWLLQLKRAGKRLAFYGDDTWLSLFPNTFAESEGVSSFFAADTVIVDRNVSRHVDAVTAKLGTSVNAVILHYLGLDHIGHTYGPHSTLMHPKQREMDLVIERIYSKLSSRDLLALLGDHGMTAQGNHGGASDQELSTALVLTSPGISRATASGLIHVNQVDLVPTLSALLGLPIPLNNVGALIPDFVTDPTARHPWLLRNAAQLLRYAAIALPDSATSAHRNAVAASCSDPDQLEPVIRELARDLAAAMSGYDLTWLAAGLVASVAVSLAALAVLPNSMRAYFLVWAVVPFASSLVEYEHLVHYTLAIAIALVSALSASPRSGCAWSLFLVALGLRAMWSWNTITIDSPDPLPSVRHWLAALPAETAWLKAAAVLVGYWRVVDTLRTFLFALYTLVHLNEPPRGLAPLLPTLAWAFAGNHASLASIDLSRAYLGLTDFHLVGTGLLTFLTTYAGPLWWMIHSGPQAASQSAILRVAVTAPVLAAVAHFRDHLFVWSVFAPKLVFDAAWLVVMPAVTMAVMPAHSHDHDHSLALSCCSTADEPATVTVTTLAKQLDDLADAQSRDAAVHLLTGTTPKQGTSRRVSFSHEDLVYEFEIEDEYECDESESDECDECDELADVVPELKSTSKYHPALPMSMSAGVYARRCETFGTMWNELASTNPAARAEAVRLMRAVFADLGAHKSQQQQLKKQQLMAVAVNPKHMQWSQWQQLEARAWQSAPQQHVFGSTTKYQHFQQQPQTFYDPVQTYASTKQPWRQHDQAFEWHNMPTVASTKAGMALALAPIAKRWVRYHCKSGSIPAAVEPSALKASKGSELD
ncbi:major facilitator super transporter protein [Blastocladiella emersonii ATCC 22665]|nr:major facilitator super transporter protein [Blastocladiella emersonii ATCC 22665]